MTSNNAIAIKSGNYMCKKLTSYHFIWSDRRDYSVPYDQCFSHNLFKTPLMKNGSSLRSNKAMVFRILGFPGGSAGKESTCNAGAGFNPWVGKIPWRRERLPTPLFWPGEFHGLYTVRGAANSWTRLNNFHVHSEFYIVIQKFKRPTSFVFHLCETANEEPLHEDKPLHVKKSDLLKNSNWDDVHLE